MNKNLLYRPGVEIPYTESADEDGYSYNFWIEWDGRPGAVFVCESGMHVEWDDGPAGWVISNIVPEKVFGPLPKLEPKHMRYLLYSFMKTGFEGWKLPVEEEERMYEEWNRLGRP